MADADELLDEQQAYYRARAGEYDDWWNRTGRAFRSDAHSAAWSEEVAEAQAWLASLELGGDVLELAAGTGNWTVELERRAASLTVVDSSPETLAINRTKLSEPERVTYHIADIFDFEPAGRFDVVFFSFWLSHVPSARFAEFWQLVDRRLAPEGRVVVVDSAHPAVMSEAPDSGLSSHGGSGGFAGAQGAISIASGTAERVLADGTRHRIVKRFWMPDELVADVADLGWQAKARNTRYFFLLADLVRSRGS